MARGSYLGGSTVIRGSGTVKKKPAVVGKGGGLLAREVAHNKTGSVSDTPLLLIAVQPTKQKTKKKPPRLAGKAAVTSRNKPAPPPASGEPVDAETAGCYLLKHHPSVPKSSRKIIIKSLRDGSWTGLTMSQALRRCADLHATYDLCGLLRINQAGVPKDEASKMIQPQKERILSIWGF